VAWSQVVGIDDPAGTTTSNTCGKRGGVSKYGFHARANSGKHKVQNCCVITNLRLLL